MTGNLNGQFSQDSVGWYVFSNRIVDKWNSLPDHCINTNTVNNFKSHISKHMEPET